MKSLCENEIDILGDEETATEMFWSLRLDLNTRPSRGPYYAFLALSVVRLRGTRGIPSFIQISQTFSRPIAISVWINYRLDTEIQSHLNP